MIVTPHLRRVLRTVAAPRLRPSAPALRTARAPPSAAALRAPSAPSAPGALRSLSIAAQRLDDPIHLPPWSTYDPTQTATHYVPNFADGRWLERGAGNTVALPDPMDKHAAAALYEIPDPEVGELAAFANSAAAVKKSGLHNPLKNVARYTMYGEVTRKAGNILSDPGVEDYFARCIMRCVPKSYGQALGEVRVTAAFLHNFAGDNVRFMAGGGAGSVGVSGDHDGQRSVGHRWPFGYVALVAPFNFPLEIPVLQLMGALYMGNKPLLKPTEKVAVVMEQFVRLLHHCGMPAGDVDLLNCRGEVAGDFITSNPIRMTQFTGSSEVADHLCVATAGKVKIEDAGFDWKILGPDVPDDPAAVDYVAWQCDQDAYAASGQKCSAQSILFVHSHWRAAGLLDKAGALASARSLAELTVGPVLTVTTQTILDHVAALLAIPGAELLWGGQELTDHNIPAVYGAVEPTAVFVPLKAMLADDATFQLCTSEIFGPFQVVTEYDDTSVEDVLEATERMDHHLTAAVVSADAAFTHRILANTVNGTTYAGMRARTTGAPQNHWFGPAGDPRGAGIGSPEAIRMVWSCHREVISDLFVPEGWERPVQT